MFLFGISRFVPRSGRRATRRRESSGAAGQVASELLESRVLLAAASLTDEEQYFLELTNRARMNPLAEVARYGVTLNQGVPADQTISSTPKQPLAPSQILVNAARLHSQDMLDRDYLNHFNSQGEGPPQRAARAGYPDATNRVGENIGWEPDDTRTRTQKLNKIHELHVKSPTHRVVLLDSRAEESGVGIRYGQFLDPNPALPRFNGQALMLTHDHGRRLVDPFITGVVYTDSNNSNFYDIGESIRSGTVSVRNRVTGQTLSDGIGPSGSYGIIVPAGTWDVTATYSAGGKTQVYTKSVTVGTDNVKLDFDSTEYVALELSLSAAVTTVNESTTTSITVTRTGPLSAALTVSLASGDITEVTVPSSIVIPAGQASVHFTASAPADTLIDGLQASRLTATATNFTPGTLTVFVNDRSAPGLPAGEQIVQTPRPVFSWSALTNAVTYEIWVNNFSSGRAKVINQAGISGTSFTSPVDLEFGTYQVWVRGVTSAGVWSFWNAVPGLWRVRLPVTLTNVPRTERTGNFRIDWAALPGATFYEVWVDRLTSRTSKYYYSGNVTGTGVDVSDFAIGRYGVWVRGRTSKGDIGLWSQQGIITVSRPVSGVRVIAPTFAGAPTLQWDALPGAARYDVWVDSLTTGATQVIRNTSVTGTQLPLTGLPSGSWRAWVRGFDSTGAAAGWSTAFDFQYQQPAQLLTPRPGTQTSPPVFSWQVVSGTVRYILTIVDSGRTPVIVEDQLTNVQYTPASPLAAGTYRAWVQAVDASGTITEPGTEIEFSVAFQSPPEQAEEQPWQLTRLLDELDRAFSEKPEELFVTEGRAEMAAPVENQPPAGIPAADVIFFPGQQNQGLVSAAFQTPRSYRFQKSSADCSSSTDS